MRYLGGYDMTRPNATSRAAGAFIAECENYYDSTGGGFAPGSRYGRRWEDCQRWAIMTAAVFADANDEHPLPDLLEHCASLIVNDHDDPAAMIADYWTPFVRACGRRLGVTLTEARQLA